MLIQLDSQCWFNLTLNVDSTWLSMLIQLDSQCWFNLTLNVDSTWLSMLIQLDSQCWFNLTLNVDSTWLSMLIQLDSQCWFNLTLNVGESSWINIESQVESTLRVKLNQHWEFNWLKYSPVIHFARSNYNSASDSTFKVKMTQFTEKIESFWPKKMGQILVPPVTIS